MGSKIPGGEFVALCKKFKVQEECGDHAAVGTTKQQPSTIHRDKMVVVQAQGAVSSYLGGCGCTARSGKCCAEAEVGVTAPLCL